MAQGVDRQVVLADRLQRVQVEFEQAAAVRIGRREPGEIGRGITGDPEALVPELRFGDDHPLTEGTGYCFGPGLTAADITAKGSGLEAMQRLYVTPIDEEHVELRGIVNVGRLDSEEATRGYEKVLCEAVFAQ